MLADLNDLRLSRFLTGVEPGVELQRRKSLNPGSNILGEEDEETVQKL